MGKKKVKYACYYFNGKKWKKEKRPKKLSKKKFKKLSQRTDKEWKKLITDVFNNIRHLYKLGYYERDNKCSEQATILNTLDNYSK